MKEVACTTRPAGTLSSCVQPVLFSIAHRTQIRNWVSDIKFRNTSFDGNIKVEVWGPQTAPSRVKGHEHVGLRYPNTIFWEQSHTVYVVRHPIKKLHSNSHSWLQNDKQCKWVVVHESLMKTWFENETFRNTNQNARKQIYHTILKILLNQCVQISGMIPAAPQMK